MTRLFRAWDRFWFAPIDPLPAAVFRVTLGTLIVLDLLAAHPNWDRFYAADGMLSLVDPTVPPVPQGWWSAFWWSEGWLPVRAYWWLGMVAALAFTLGWHTRLATILLFVVVASCVRRTPVAVNGEDLVFRMLLFYACFTDLGLTFSLDARRRGGLPATLPPRWPIRLMQVNLALIYLISQPYKLASDPAWLDGDAMYYVMVNRTWSRFPWPSLYYSQWIAEVSTYGSLVVELALPILVWIPLFQPWVVVATAALHVVIAVELQSVAFFSLAMVAGLAVFLTAADLQRLTEPVRRAWRMVWPVAVPGPAPPPA